MSHVQKVPSSESSTLGCAVSMMRVHGMLSFGPTSRAKATMATLPLSTSASCRSAYRCQSNLCCDLRTYRMVPYTLCMLLFDIAAYMLCMLSSCNWVEDCMVAMLDPAVEAARLPRVCPMTLGYRGLPRSSNDKNMHDTQKGLKKQKSLTFVKGPAPFCSMSAPRRAGMIDATIIVTKAPRIAKGAVLSCA